MDWLAGYGQVIFMLVTIALVVGLCGYVTYGHSRDRLRHDLELLIANALDYLKEWTKGQLAAITRDDVVAVAMAFYERYVAGTSVGKWLTEEQFANYLWEVFVRWRDQFASLNVAMGQAVGM